MTTKYTFNPFTGNLDLITATLSPSDITGGTPNTVAGFDTTGALESIPGWTIDVLTGGPNISLNPTPADANANFIMLDQVTAVTPPANLTQLEIYNLRSYMTLNGPQNFHSGRGLSVVLNKSDAGTVDLMTAVEVAMNIGDGTNATIITDLNLTNEYLQVNNNATITNNHTLLNIGSNVMTGATIGGMVGLNINTTIDGTSTQNINLIALNVNSNSSQTGIGIQGIGMGCNIYSDLQFLNGFGMNTQFQSGANLVNSSQAFFDNTNVQSGATISGGMQSYGANPNIQVGSIVNGYTGININPGIATPMAGFGSNIITGGGSYSAAIQQVNMVGMSGQFNSGAAVTNGIVGFQENSQMQSGSSANYMTSYGAFPNMHPGSTLDQYQGINIAPNFDIAITNNFTLANLNVSGTGSAASVTGLNISLNNISSAQRKTAINSGDGNLNINGSFTTVSSLGVDIINTISPNLNIVAGTPITGTTVFGNGLTNILVADDDFAAGPLGISLAAVAYVNVIQVATGKTVDAVSMSFAGGQFNGDGTTTDVNLYDAIGAVTGAGTPLITNLYAFRGHFALSGLATNVWGLSIEDATAENFMQKSLAIDTATKKVTNASVGLEIGGTTKALRLPNLTTTERNALTPLAGMEIYNTTTTSIEFYNGTIWTDGNIATPVSIANGGTGQTTQTAAFDALAPTTTKGDLIVHNGTDNVREPVGTDGDVLTADSGSATGVSYQTPAAGVTSSLDLKNVGLSFSAAANALTIHLVQADGTTDPDSSHPCKIAFRDVTVTSGAYNVRSATVATSLTIPSGATLGHDSGSNCYFYVYAIDVAGTIELAVSSIWRDDSVITSSSAISSTADDSPLWSTANHATVPYRLIGRFFYSTAPAGTYTATPDEVAVMGGDLLFDNQYYSITDTNSYTTTPTENTWFIPSTAITVTLTPGTYIANVKLLITADFGNSVPATNVRELARIQLGDNTTAGTGLLADIYGAFEFFFPYTIGVMTSELIGADINTQSFTVVRTTNIYVNLKYTAFAATAGFGAGNGFRGDLSPSILEFRKVKV